MTRWRLWSYYYHQHRYIIMCAKNDDFRLDIWLRLQSTVIAETVREQLSRPYSSEEFGCSSGSRLRVRLFYNSWCVRVNHLFAIVRLEANRKEWKAGDGGEEVSWMIRRKTIGREIAAVFIIYPAAVRRVRCAQYFIIPRLVNGTRSDKKLNRTRKIACATPCVLALGIYYVHARRRDKKK